MSWYLFCSTQTRTRLPTYPSPVRLLLPDLRVPLTFPLREVDSPTDYAKGASTSRCVASRFVRVRTKHFVRVTGATPTPRKFPPSKRVQRRRRKWTGVFGPSDRRDGLGSYVSPDTIRNSGGVSPLQVPRGTTRRGPPLPPCRGASEQGGCGRFFRPGGPGYHTFRLR